MHADRQAANMDDGWKVIFAEDEILLEYRVLGEIQIVVGFDDDGGGYAFRKNDQFIPGAHDLSSDHAGAIEEIKDFIRADR